jgi:V8-like Glu-specific endopeptidase
MRRRISVGLRTRPFWKIAAISVTMLAAFVGIPGLYRARAEIISPTCYALTLLVDGGMGLPPTASEPNCTGGLYVEGTVVNLLAHPGQDSSVYRWRGTDHDSSTATTNTVTMNFDREVGIHYVHEGNPDTPVSRGSTGGVATFPQLIITPEAVIGTDDRVQITPTTNPPDRMVVFLISTFPDAPPGDATGCTGTFFGPHTIITSGHCVYDSYQGGWADSVEVSPARDGDTLPYGSQFASQWESTDGWVYSGLATADYAAIIMPDDTLGNQVGWWSYGYYSNSYLLGRQVTITGYPGDKLLGTMWTDTDPITTISSDWLLVAYTVDTYGGQSGASVYYLDSGEPVAVAIHGYTAGYVNYGPRITKAVADVLAGWGAANSPRTDCATIPTVSLLSPVDTTLTNEEPIDFTWTSATGASSYRYTLLNSDLSAIVFETTTPATSYSYSSLADGTYYWQITALTGVSGCPNSDPSALWQIDVDRTPPSVPDLLSPGAVTQLTQPTFDWSDSTGDPSQYQLQVDDAADFSDPKIDVSPAGSTYTATSPLALGTYSWRVRARDAVGNWSAWSDVWSFTIDQLRLAAPGLIRPEDHTYTKDTTPTFLWKNVKGAVLYEIQVSDDYAFGVPLVDAQTTSRYYTPPAGSELNYGIYFWRVRAQDGNGNWSDWSYTNTLTITILASPKNAQHLTDTTPTLRWQSAAYGALYEVEVDEVGGDFSTPVFTTSGTARYIAVTPDLPGGDYQWRARANTGTGWSVWTPAWTFTVTPATTAAPALISPTNYATLDTTTPDFSWNAVPNGVTYQLQIATNGSFKTPVQDMTLPAGVLTYTADPLADGGRYYWRVRAINAEGVAGAWSAKWQFTLNQLVKPVLLAPVSGTQTTDTTPDLSWYPVTDAVGYEIQLDTDRRFGTPDQTLNTASTTITPAALADGKYYWRVRAVNGFGVTGLWSAVWNVTVDTTGPDQPVLSSPANLAGTRDTTPTLGWKSAKTAKQYHLQVAEDLDFAVAHVEVEVTVTGRTYTVPAVDALDYGVHYWRVQAADALDNWGDWSTPFQFALTNMLSPKDGATTTSLRPTFSWAAVTGAVVYNFELADNPNFIGPVETFSGPNRSFRPATPLAAGPYYWHVNVDGGDWMPTWTLVITPAKPGRPALSSPANRSITSDNTPTFGWLSEPYPFLHQFRHQIQIDNQRDFSSPEQDVIVGVGLLSYIADELPDGTYYWRVRVIYRDQGESRWTGVWQIAIDTLAPPVPEMLAPLNGAASTNRMLKLNWTKVDGASAYELQLDPDPAFPLPVISTGSKTTYTPPTPLSRGTYWWQVRALDKAGNASDWSTPRSFEIVAGITAPTVEAPTPLPTEPPAPGVEPTQPPEPTIEPTVEPTQPPEPTIEPTPEPTVEPPTPPDNPQPVVTPPVNEPFDSKAGWQAKGVWKFGKNTGVEGGGWFADSTRRGATSLLTAPVLIDLTTAQAPTLRYWQRVGLSSGDLAAVDVSTDGGQTWQPLDQQLGHPAEWSERTVDLSAYRGQVIRLRFRLDARGRVPQGEQTVGWWVDTISVQDDSPTP